MTVRPLERIQAAFGFLPVAQVNEVLCKLLNRILGRMPTCQIRQAGTKAGPLRAKVSQSANVQPARFALYQYDSQGHRRLSGSLGFLCDVLSYVAYAREGDS